MNSLDIIDNICELNDTYAGEKISFINNGYIYFGVMISNKYCLTRDGIFDIINILKCYPVYYLLDYYINDKSEGLVKRIKVSDMSNFNFKNYPAVYFLSDNYVNDELNYLIHKINTHYLLSLYKYSMPHRGFIEWVNGDYYLNLGKCHLKEYNKNEYDGYVYLAFSQLITDINELLEIKYSLICLEQECDSDFICGYINLENTLKNLYCLYSPSHDSYNKIIDISGVSMPTHKIIKKIDNYFYKWFVELDLKWNKEKYIHIILL